MAHTQSCGRASAGCGGIDSGEFTRPYARVCASNAAHITVWRGYQYKFCLALQPVAHTLNARHHRMAITDCARCDGGNFTRYYARERARNAAHSTSWQGYLFGVERAIRSVWQGETGESRGRVCWRRVEWHNWVPGYLLCSKMQRGIGAGSICCCPKYGVVRQWTPGTARVIAWRCVDTHGVTPGLGELWLCERV